MSAIATLARTAARPALSLPRCTRLTQFTLARFNSTYPPHHIINMPALSPTMTQGNLGAWKKKAGDELKAGEPIAEIETDKAAMDFEFQEDGWLAKILVDAGAQNVKVNTPIAVYVDKKDDVDAFKDFSLAPKKGAKKDDAKSSEAPSSSPAASQKTSAPTDRILASPAAKNLALEKGIALKNIKGSGPNGRITKEDVEKAGAGGSAGSGSSGPSYTDIPITTMRKVIGKRLLESTLDNPSYIISSQISVSKLLKLRGTLNAAAKDRGFKISVNDMLVKALASAAKRVPEANTHWIEAEGVMRQYNNVDVSVAVATPTGLITPIVKSAESKGLEAISKEIKDLGKRAKDNKLKPEEFQGGTLTISNLGMNHAVTLFTSIINPPQAAIFAIGTVQKIAVPDKASENGFIFDDKINITGTFDHRVIDGAKGGEYIKALKEIIENPLELLL